MICCWCGREIACLDAAIWGFWPDSRVHLQCFFHYVGDRMVRGEERRELVDELDLGGEA